MEGKDERNEMDCGALCRGKELAWGPMALFENLSYSLRSSQKEIRRKRRGAGEGEDEGMEGGRSRAYGALFMWLYEA